MCSDYCMVRLEVGGQQLNLYRGQFHGTGRTPAGFTVMAGRATRRRAARRGGSRY